MTTRPMPRTVSEPEGAAAIAAGEGRLIDVRTPAEFAAGHLAGAELIDIQAPDFAERVDALERDASYLLYCRSGNRSAHAALAMAAMGFADVTDIGGFDALAAAGAPVAGR